MVDSTYLESDEIRDVPEAWIPKSLGPDAGADNLMREVLGYMLGSSPRGAVE